MMEIVHDKPEEGHIINIEGKKGQSLFHHPVIWVIEKDFQRINEQYKRYWKLIDETQEERLLALIGALSMEEALDLFLGAYIPDYTRIVEFTLSQKIEVARSLRMIPAHIVDAAVLVNNVRNKFAHELEIDCFDSLDTGTKDNLRQKHGVFYPDDADTDLKVRDMFLYVVVGVIVGLGIYSSHLRVAKEYIYSEDFSKEFDKRIKGKPR